MFRKVIASLALLVTLSVASFGQSVRIDAAGNGDFVMPPAVRVGYSNWIDIYNYGFTTHILSYRVVGSPASFTLTLECSNTGSDSASSVLGTGSTVTGGAITATATPCTRVRWHLSALSGAATIYLTYHGSFAAASGGGGGGGAVTGSGTEGSRGADFFSVQGGPSGTPIPVTSTSTVVDCADATTVCTSPVPTACVYTTSPTPLTTGQGGYLYCGPGHELKIAPAPGPLKSGAVSSAMTSTTSTSVIAGTASNYTYIGWCLASNASLTVSTDILLQDGSGGTTLAVVPAPAAAVATTGGGGAMTPFSPPLKVTTVGNGLFAANVTSGSSTKITCGGFTSTTSF